MSGSDSSGRMYIFDCDQTLYPVGHPFYGEVTKWLGRRFESMTGWTPEYVASEVARLRALGHEPGIEMNKAAGITQVEMMGDFHLHQPYHLLEACAETRTMLSGLVGRKVILTHGLRPYTQRILERLELADQFEHIYDMVDVGNEGKAHMDFAHFANAVLGVKAEACTYLEDSAACLAPAHAAGMRTVLLHPTLTEHRHAHAVSPTLTGWLAAEVAVSRAA